MSGPSSIKSPATNSVSNEVPEPVTVLVWVVTETLPVIVEDHAFALGHTETWIELPSSPGYFATHEPTPEIPDE